MKHYFFKIRERVLGYEFDAKAVFTADDEQDPGPVALAIAFHWRWEWDGDSDLADMWNPMFLCWVIDSIQISPAEIQEISPEDFRVAVSLSDTVGCSDMTPSADLVEEVIAVTSSKSKSEKQK